MFLTAIKNHVFTLNLNGNTHSWTFSSLSPDVGCFLHSLPQFFAHNKLMDVRVILHASHVRYIYKSALKTYDFWRPCRKTKYILPMRSAPPVEVGGAQASVTVRVVTSITWRLLGLDGGATGETRSKWWNKQHSATTESHYSWILLLLKRWLWSHDGLYYNCLFKNFSKNI